MLGTTPENLSETKFCQIIHYIQVDEVIDRSKYFFNRFTRVSLTRGQTSPFSVWTVDGHYNTVILPYNCDTNLNILLEEFLTSVNFLLYTNLNWHTKSFKK